MQKEDAFTHTHKSTRLPSLAILHIFSMENMPLTTLYLLNTYLAVFVY